MNHAFEKCVEIARIGLTKLEGFEGLKPGTLCSEENVQKYACELKVEFWLSDQLDQVPLDEDIQQERDGLNE